jgi:3-methyladenine DNA glycosylase Tag
VAYSYEDILRSQYEAKAADRAQALADLEAARLNENAVDTMNAADRILEIDKSVGALNTIANQYVRQSQAQPQGNKFGLSPAEVEIARTSYTAPDMTDAQKDETFARNKQKLQSLRASGAYTDSDRQVFRDGGR